MMTLPDYKDSLEYWTEMDKRFSCGLLYGFLLYENYIVATVTDTLSNLPVFALTDIPYFSSFAQLYLFPTIPNQADFSLYLKDFLQQIKLKRIHNDFT